MGISPFRFSKSSLDSASKEEARRLRAVNAELNSRLSKNPRPDKYRILDSEQIGDFLILFVHYDGCTNYEGKKVLVFKDTTLADLKVQKLIDPHFSNTSHYKHPIARFVPTPYGRKAARLLATSLTQLEKEG